MTGRFGFRQRRAVVAALVVAASATGSALAFVGLPGDGTQVNSDAAAGIDPARSAGIADVAGGSLDATKAAVPWAVFEQATASQQQIFARSFADGTWTTRGGSLNVDQAQDGEAPAIDFAGAGRTVPWVSWYEQSAALGGNTQIFARRFNATTGAWIVAGQQRGAGATKPSSLNIDTSENAENPSVAGGATNAGTDPVPWITWQETALNGAGPTTRTNQIFVTRGVKLDAGAPDCPPGTKPAAAGSTNPVGGFCWQQVGIERVASNHKPSLNVDVTRDGVEPDIAFTGTNDTVPWVVWYEQGGPGLFGVSDQRVFAAKGVADASADGAFHWVAVGNGTAGKAPQVLGTAADGCIASLAAEDACALNKDPAKNAEDARVAAGTMTAGGIAVPWVVWDEDVNGVKQVFVSHLVGGDHFELVNAGAPISLGANDSTRPDITFSGNTPYVSWRERISGSQVKAFVGHFVDPNNPTFVLDDPGGTAVSANGVIADQREPVSSPCTAPLFTGSPQVCQGGALGSPFFLLADGDPLVKLFGQGYGPAAPATGPATGTSVQGSVDPQGGPVEVHFDYGTTAAYGQSTAPQRLGPANGATPFGATLSGLPDGATIHYRAVARGDFGTLTGADQTLATPAAPTGGGGGGGGGGGTTGKDTIPPHLTAKLRPTTLGHLRSSHKLKIVARVNERGKISISLRVGKAKLGSHRYRIRKTGKHTLTFTLSNAAQQVVAAKRKLTLRLTVVATDAAGNRSLPVHLRRTLRARRT